jgi:hypothetical protein
MAAKGYCTVQNVADFLAQDFSTIQQNQCNVLIEQAEAYIDGATNRGWLVGAQTDEAFYYPPHKIFVRYAPVTSVQAVTGRTTLGQSEATLVANTDYEVRDLAGGLIYLLYPASYDRVMVDYTPVASVPADIKRACIELVSAWLQPNLQPGTYGLDSYSLPDLTVKFARSHVQAAAPPAVQQVLDYYRYWVHA